MPIEKNKEEAIETNDKESNKMNFSSIYIQFLLYFYRSLMKAE